VRVGLKTAFRDEENQLGLAMRREERAIDQGQLNGDPSSALKTGPFFFSTCSVSLHPAQALALAGTHRGISVLQAKGRALNVRFMYNRRTLYTKQ
jgi:hypothetical protein